ncbi:hypothetical protein EV183_005218 [Coemansia sp. RSA 2336]|nr:hypothetical protein EV183_005218 [Coemansia sp. RSA 2336]
MDIPDNVRNKRNAVAAASVALVGLLAYVVYEVYQEATKTYSSDDDTRSDSDVEDVIHIPPPPPQTSEDGPDQATLFDADNISNSPRKSLAISARGIVFDSLDGSDKWSSHIRIRKDAVSSLEQLARHYQVYLIIVTRPEQEQGVLEALAEAGIVAFSGQIAGVTESTVWVNKNDSDDTNSTRSFDEIPSSAISSILNMPSSPGIVPLSNVLFCQTEEGKVHLARHLLTANPHVTSRPTAGGYAGYMDTNRDVVARLSQVLHNVVLVDPSPEYPVIGQGDIPGSSTAFSSANIQNPSAAELATMQLWVIGDRPSSMEGDPDYPIIWICQTCLDMASTSRTHSAELVDTSGGQTSQDQRLRPPHSGEEGQSSSDAPLRPKRAQVKNACVNCQRACKKCDSGRPCQRCIKYNLADTCVDSKRKPRKKGIKRGPYKKRKKNHPDDDVQPQASVGEPALEAPRASGTTSGGSRRASMRVAQAEPKRRRQPRGSDRPPGVLGPGAIPILHTDPAYDESDGSSSDVPLVVQQRRAGQPIAAQYGMPPETPTAGLTTAFRSLDTGHGALSPTARQPHRPAAPYPPSTIGSIRLPPIESFDHAQALASPPSTSSLAILTDVALGHSSLAPRPPLHPPLPRPPAHYPHQPVSPEDSNQQSQLHPPDHSHHSTSAESDVSTHYASSDSRLSPDFASRAYIRRLSHRLHHTHLEQEPADS